MFPLATDEIVFKTAKISNALQLSTIIWKLVMGYFHKLNNKPCYEAIFPAGLVPQTTISNDCFSSNALKFSVNTAT